MTVVGAAKPLRLLFHQAAKAVIRAAASRCSVKRAEHRGSIRELVPDTPRASDRERAPASSPNLASPVRGGGRRRLRELMRIDTVVRYALGAASLVDRFSSAAPDQRPPC
jgi:hypothetical protein